MKIENEVKHTPGPWKVITHEEWEKLHQDSAHYFSSVAQVNHEGYLEYLICQCADKGSLTKTQANARLIASAPELLEALKNCINALCGDYSPYNAILQAKQIVAKAEGN